MISSLPEYQIARSNAWQISLVSYPSGRHDHINSVFVKSQTLAVSVDIDPDAFVLIIPKGKNSFPCCAPLESPQAPLSGHYVPS